MPILTAASFLIIVFTFFISLSATTGIKCKVVCEQTSSLWNLQDSRFRTIYECHGHTLQEKGNSIIVIKAKKVTLLHLQVLISNLLQLQQKT